jgi:hypothetical protein
VNRNDYSTTTPAQQITIVYDSYGSRSRREEMTQKIISTH